MRLVKRDKGSKAMLFASPLLALLLTLISGLWLFTTLEQPAWAALKLFFWAPISDLYGWSELSLKATPLILCAAGLSLCYRAKLWNIGAEGQFVIGGIIGTVIALKFNHGDATWGLYIALLGGALGGLLWAALVACLRVQFNCNETLTTIMLNYVAGYLLLWAIYGPLKNPNGFNFPESELFNAHLLMPQFSWDYRANYGFLFALASLAVVWFINQKTLLGFKINVLGESPKAARFAGFKPNQLRYFALGFSGATAGLAGFIEVSGAIGQLTPHLPQGYGFAAIIVVFLGRMHPVGILLAAFLIALTFIGGENLQLELGLPKSMSLLFQGLILFYLLMADVLIHYRIQISPELNAGHA